jgi:parallel beta-helix repeat protein
MNPQSSPPKWFVGTAAVFLLIAVPALAVTAGIYYAISPSSFMKQVTSQPKGERIIFSGSADRGRILDGGGGWINGGRYTEILIQSERKGDRWERPDGAIIRNGKLRGSIRVVGLGRNGEAEGVRHSATSPGHTERAQEAAPQGVVLSNLEIEADRDLPVYLAPGTTGAIIENCVFTGWSVVGALYLDAESGGNTIRGNRFELKGYREAICIDGSANNRIEGNRFERIDHGGIYLYRNCGEGGTVRHQTPRENTIRGNAFALDTLGFGSYAIWIGSRNGRRSYCEADAGYPFGSSADNRDFANDNVIASNTFDPLGLRAVRDDGEGNVVGE